MTVQSIIPSTAASSEPTLQSREINLYLSIIQNFFLNSLSIFAYLKGLHYIVPELNLITEVLSLNVINYLLLSEDTADFPTER